MYNKPSSSMELISRRYYFHGTKPNTISFDASSGHYSHCFSRPARQTITRVLNRTFRFHYYQNTNFSITISMFEVSQLYICTLSYHNISACNIVMHYLSTKKSPKQASTPKGTRIPTTLNKSSLFAGEPPTSGCRANVASNVDT